MNSINIGVSHDSGIIKSRDNVIEKMLEIHDITHPRLFGIKILSIDRQTPGTGKSRRKPEGKQGPFFIVSVTDIIVSEPN
jgi:hypothetical protein